MKNIHINNKGFTLIELLVVISIIALLVSIVMPSLGTARMLAQKAACMATLKGIGQSWNMYLDSYNRIWPTKDDKKGFIVEVPSAYRDGVFYDDLDAEVYTINDAMKDYFPVNGWKCSSNQGKEEFDKCGTSYEFYPSAPLEITSEGFRYNNNGIDVVIDSNAVMKACDTAASSSPIVTDIISGIYGSGPHRLNPREDEICGYAVVYHDAHVEVTDSDTLDKNMADIAKALLPEVPDELEQ